MRTIAPYCAFLTSLCLHAGIVSAFILHPTRPVEIELPPVVQLVKLAPAEPVMEQVPPSKPAAAPKPRKERQAKAKTKTKTVVRPPPKPKRRSQSKPPAKPLPPSEALHIAGAPVTEAPVKPAIAQPTPVVSQTGAIAAKPQSKPVDRPVNLRAAYLNNPKPSYPHIARRRGWEGVVILRLDLDKKGQALRVDIATSSGHTVLDKAAQAAVKRWRFAPATRDGQAVVARNVRVPIQFTLKDS